jgi:hypothetical protein
VSFAHVKGSPPEVGFETIAINFDGIAEILSRAFRIAAAQPSDATLHQRISGCGNVTGCCDPNSQERTTRREESAFRNGSFGETQWDRWLKSRRGL